MNNLPEHIERWYSLKKLYSLGGDVGWALLLVLLVGLGISVWNPVGKKQLPTNQYQRIDANEIKRNSTLFHHFLSQVKTNNGRLLLGTSETGDLDYQNYFHWFNADSTRSRKFSVLGGVGRRVDVYLPLIEASPEAWNGLDVCLFLNPTYFRFGLNEPRESYQKRYLDPGFIFSQKKNLTKDNAFKFYRKVLKEKTRLLGSFAAFGYFWDQWRSTFYTDFRVATEWIDLPYENPVQKSRLKPIDFDAYLKEQDTSLNVTFAFAEHQEKLWFPAVDTTQSYQHEILSKFYQLCNRNGINLTVIIGPYNAVLAKAVNQTWKLSAYEQLHGEIHDSLSKYSINTIDLWDLSYDNRMFKDYQHHGNYGAYIIYKRIKNELDDTH